MVSGHLRRHVFMLIRLVNALLTPEPGGDQGTLFARNVVQGHGRA